MSTPKAPSVLNSDVSLPLRPDTSAPSGDRLLSPNNDAGVPNKRTRTVSADNMEVELTTTSTTTTTTAPGPVLAALCLLFLLAFLLTKLP
ncbi:unnamed protein product [Rhizophagus irregularis]|nr:unnamed protein product [Rhizophagus irregularis]